MTERDALPFWFDDGIPTQGASADQLAAAEAQIGHRLPRAFSELLLQRDGGVSNYAYRGNDDVQIPLPGFFNITTLVSAHGGASHFGTPEGVVAIASDADAWLGLDYRASENDPSVVYQASEDEDLETIAASFKSFLASLVEEE